MSEPPLLAAPPEAVDDDPPVSTFMTRDVVTVDADAGPGTALREMARHGVRHLVLRVGDREEGAVTEASVLRAVADDRPDAPLRQFRVVLPGIPADTRRTAVARRMVEHRVDAALVVDGDRVVGIVTATDLVRSLAGASR
ncbi:CBS domain-containing protein [Pseudonocardia thermophila]|jgi:Predicted transcriptional regulator, contains C-terminal CBS domains|uniref:CBS domain-containing protein n=1 Tax=Pseudonocardia thermophila TaxID=1848 RepID=A0A1M6V036_PSETH|nr:CBS domain-containing protein [Pseudonocardia thermophila]SHK74800.1 CBS domain-containing protein [Pseudonocardia thermophila]